MSAIAIAVTLVAIERLAELALSNPSASHPGALPRA